MNIEPNDNNDLDKKLDNFLDNDSQEECTDETCLIPKRDGLVERVNKKMITNDGRELLV